MNYHQVQIGVILRILMDSLSSLAMSEFYLIGLIGFSELFIGDPVLIGNTQ